MVAKRNSEVERLNATARGLLKADGRLGQQEIEVGEARFAAGDQVITRVNDHGAAIYNRERWQVAEVDPEKDRVVLEGIDQQRTVEVGPDYLARTTPHGEAPALQHAYAVTTYCAQGTTVDRAYVMADPSMDKQEFYVATSRSRDETYLYATPEIQAERAEYAPKPPEREAIGHVAEAAQRDRAQTAAHDEALRSELRKLPSEELVARREALSEAASQEGRADARRAEQQKWVDHEQTRYENAVKNREAVEGLGWRERRRQLPRAVEREQKQLESLRTREQMRDRWGPPRDEARRERGIARQILVERSEPAILASRLAPPSYIVKELGERPAHPEKAKAWDSGVRSIETYRHEHGVKDTDNALGHRADGGRDHFAQDRARDAQRRLQRQQQLDRSMQRSQEMDHGFDLGIG